ncbi:MAG: bis(5'-nucleosyl)-tetraphosphatase (symmetrical) YqeK, partial [Neglectibacter timonensis]
MTYEQCECEVRQRLSEKRFYHSQCVAEEAVRLAVLYGADPEKARLAGLLHDILKDTPAEEQLKILQGFGIMMNDTELANQKLWHAISGAAFLEFGLGIRDRELLSAVRCHTSGRKNMTLLEKVLFVADYISADRDYPGVEELRAVARESLEEAIIEGVAFT